MTATTGLSATDLLALFAYPIERVSQVMFRSNLEREGTGLINSWGGIRSVVTFDFSCDYSASYLCVAVAKDSLICQRWDSQTTSKTYLLKFIREVYSKDVEDEDDIIGLFDLDAVVSPVPDWKELRITHAAVLTRCQPEIEGQILGFCLWINLGIRLGVFVAPNPGLALSFNDTCDIIMRQARNAERLRLLRIDQREYPGKETPKQMTTLDWFDWLR